MTTKNIKRFLSLTNILIIICVILFSTLMYIMYKEYKSDDDAATVALNALNTPIIFKKDDQGRTHAIKPAVNLNREMAAAVAKPLFDSVCKALEISKKQIEELRAIGTYTTGTIVPNAAPVKIDEHTASCQFHYADSYFVLEGIVCSGKDSIRYAYADSFHITRYWERNKVLGMRIGKKRHYLDAYSLNKQTVVKGLTGLDITTESFNRVTLSGYTGYRSQYDLQAFNAGIEAEIYINKRTSVEISGEYYLNSGHLRPAVFGKAKFSLLKL